MAETVVVPVGTVVPGDVLHYDGGQELVCDVERVGIHIYLQGPPNTIQRVYDDADTVTVTRNDDPSCALVVVPAGELRRHDWVQVASGHGFHIDRITTTSPTVTAEVNGTFKTLGDPDTCWVVERQRAPVAYSRADGLGEHLVRLDHNPSDSDTVYAIKQAAAALIDLVAELELGDTVAPFDENWERAIAIERAAEAAMWAVRAATHE